MPDPNQQTNTSGPHRHWLVRLVRFLFLPRLAIKPETYEYTSALGGLSTLKCFDPWCPRIHRFKWQKLPKDYEWWEPEI